mmetsp:Transcript_6660/g.21020  ORF Transcript_6660/g.21020 Transcript_6660/m.21020 type:complete len:299 (+) Transcript_6660:1850-2746(+)
MLAPAGAVRAARARAEAGGGGTTRSGTDAGIAPASPFDARAETNKGSKENKAPAKASEHRAGIQVRRVCRVRAGPCERRPAGSTHMSSEDAGDKLGGHLGEIAIPILAVLLGAPLVVPHAAVHQVRKEEGKVYERHPRAEPADEAPAERHGEVGRVMRLACVRPPATDEQLGASVRCHVLRVFERLPRELRQRPRPLDVRARLLHPEVVLLRVGRIPDVIGRAQDHVERDRVPARVLDRPGDLCEIDRLEAVDERHARKVPEDEHPAVLLVKDVPCRRDALLALHARVRVEEMREAEE